MNVIVASHCLSSYWFYYLIPNYRCFLLFLLILPPKESFAVPDLSNSKGDFCMQFIDVHQNISVNIWF